MTASQVLADLLEATPGWDRLAERSGLDRIGVEAILDEAARFAERELLPLGRNADAQGCRLENGRVITPDGYPAAYRALGQGGWLATDLPEELGGSALPLAIHTAASFAFDGVAMPFMMLAGSARAAAHLLIESSAALAGEWVPRLASGEWSATICISEPDAGSDVGRIRTKAVRAGEAWRIQGTKCWISFGDHDMTARIGHCLLAHTGPVEFGTRGLSLFLVPDRLADGRGNGITVTRIEEKLGLHGSPTCVLDFAGAEGVLLGEEGRGLPQLFAMIARMRLQTGCQGLGIAVRAAAIARTYAGERRQGGRPDAPPLPLIEHADIRRQLLDMDGRVEVLRALLIEIAVLMDLARDGDGDAEALAGWALPLAKNFGGETGFAVASAAMQVLGGAGYTREWPIEALLRDARIITIYEGTTGMQGQDFLHRRLLRDQGAGLGAFLDRSRADLDGCTDPAMREAARDVITRFETLSRCFLAGGEGLAPADLAADGYLRAGWAAVSAWMACRLIQIGGADARAARMRLHFLPGEFGLADAACRLVPALVDQL